MTLEPKAATLKAQSANIPYWVDVTDVTWIRRKYARRKFLRKVACCFGFAPYTGWGSIGRERQPSRKAESWWREQALEPKVPKTVDDAIIVVDG